MNRRKATMALLVIGASVVAARAQQPNKLPRVGVLGVDLERAPEAVAAFRQRLQDLGYADGRNIEVVYRSAEGKAERLPALARELVALPVDAIVATGGVPAATAAREATAAIPIVFIGIGDPVKSGLVGSLARPGGNATGLSTMFPETVATLVRLVHDTLPHAKRVALLIDTNLPSTGVGVKNAEAAAQPLGIRIHEAGVRRPEDFERVFAELSNTRTDAIIIFGSPMVLGERRLLATIALKYRIPLFAALWEYTEAGALMSYGPSLPGMFVQAANYVDKILKGSKPGELPVEQPTNFDLVVNRHTATVLRITLPKQVLQRATR